MGTTKSPAVPARIVSHLLAEDAEMRDLVTEFVDGLSQRVRELEQAYQALDWTQLTMLAHRLKGAGGSYGYPDISTLGATMESAFRSQRAERFTQWLQELQQLAGAAKAGLGA